MAIGDHITRVPKLRVVVSLVDTENGVIDVIAHDGAARRLGINSIPAFFRWPVEGEEWMIEEQNGQWNLSERVRPAVLDDVTIDPSLINPGDIAVDVGLTNQMVAAKFNVVTPAGLPDLTVLHTIPRKYTEVIGDGTTSTFYVVHYLGTRAVTYSVVENLTSVPQPVALDVVTEVNDSYLKLEFAAAPSVNEFLVTVIG